MQNHSQIFNNLKQYNDKQIIRSCESKGSVIGTMVELKGITKENIDDVLQLKVSETQKDFVSSTAHSLALAYVYRKTAYPFAIYADDIIVGFVMLGYYEKKAQYTLWKFLIDAQYQNRGYGRESLKLAIHYLAENFKVKEVFTGVAFQNAAAKHLYSSFGFKETGAFDGAQLEMKLTL